MIATGPIVVLCVADVSALEPALVTAGFVVKRAASVAAAIEDPSLDALVVDESSLDADGLSALARELGDASLVVLGASGAEAAVAAIRAGARDYLPLSVSAEEVAFALQKACAATACRPELAPAVGTLLGQGRAMAKAHGLIARASTSAATVLVRGESGTGKELVARAIHEGSARAAGPFVKVHCGALPDTLLESELFGYEKGAFTGAVAQKRGRVELADGGTLFLDEIGDVSPVGQVKLLRLLQDKEFERLGGTSTHRADVRFVAATHRDLESLVARGEFRADLFYRLNVVPVWMPPLRARPEDVALLAAEFCRRASERHARGRVELSVEALSLLRAQRWPGNVRQLENFIERLVVLSTGPSIGADLVRDELAAETPFRTQASTGGPATATVTGPLDDVLRDAERKAIERALAKCAGNRTLAAKLLGLGRRTLYTKMAAHGIG